MQNVVAVASTSPPNVIASTKPDVQAAPASIQESFELIFQKTSERFVENDRNDVKTTEGSDYSDAQKVQGPSDQAKVRSTQEKKEVKEAKNEQNTEKAKDEEKSTTSEVEETTVKADAVAMRQQFVSVEPLITETKGQETIEVIDPSTVEVVAAENQNKAGFSTMPEKAALKNEEAAKQVIDVETKVTDTQKPEAGVKGDLPKVESIKEQLPVNEKAVSLQDKVIYEQPEKVVAQEAGNANQEKVNNTESNQSKQQEINGYVTKQDQKSGSTQIKMETGVSEKEIEVKVTKDAAPPDTPKVTENAAVNANQIVTQTSTLNEPARLAEAPRNEVISQIANQLDQMVKTNRSSVRMQLYPEELGHIDIKIVSTKAGIGVTMVADNANTQNALKSEMNSLKQNMQQAGIELSDLNIGQGQNSNKQQNYEDRQMFDNFAYQHTYVSANNSIQTDKKVQLQTTAVDYRI